MVFLAPLALLGLLLVSLPLLIHLLVRRRGRRLDFPSLRFLRETPSFKLYPRRIRQPLLLALRAAAIILLALGLARPLFTSSSQTSEAVRFILIDASLSMKTRGRAEAAREQARAIINKLSSGERASIIALSSEAMVLEELTTDKERLLEAVGRYQPTGGALDYGAGFAEIRTKLRNEPQVSVQADIISDFQLSGLEDGLEAISRETAQLRIVTYPVGSEIERNASLIDEEVGKNVRGVELHASEIVSEIDGRSVERRVWAIDESEGARPGIEWRTEAGGQIAGRLEVLGPDEFDADDERFFAFMPPRENRILLIEDDRDASLYLRAALESGVGKEEANDFSLETRRNLPDSEADLASFSLIVMTLQGAARGDEMRVLTEYVRAGGNVLMCVGRDADAASWSQLAGTDAGRELPFTSLARRSGEQSLHFGAMDAAAAQLRELDEGAWASLGAVRAKESYLVTPRDSADTLIRWNDGTPAFISSRTGAGMIMLLATSVERASSELGLSPAFPALASSILRSTQFPREPLSQTIGEAIRLNVAPETEVKITSALGQATATKARELIRRPLVYFSEPGIYRLEFAGQQKLLAFNAPALESERSLATGDELRLYFSTDKTESARTVKANASSEAMERSGSTWRYFLCAAFLLMIAELFVAMGQRKSVEAVSE